MNNIKKINLEAMNTFEKIIQDSNELRQKLNQYEDLESRKKVIEMIVVA